MSIQERKIDKATLDGIIIDLQVLCDRCQKDCNNSYILNVPYYISEFNHILENGQKANLEFFKDTPRVDYSSKFLESPKYDKKKYILMLLHGIEASASKLLARTVNTRDATKEIPMATTAQAWEAIEKEFGITKKAFGKKINFVSDNFKRKLIFRDVEQAYTLVQLSYAKPAVILAGSVIEELLRLYLKQKGYFPKKPLKMDFNGYIRTCEQEKLLEKGISRLTDSVRHFRNIAHLRKEETKKRTISQATAKGAVSSIFTIANDF